MSREIIAEIKDASLGFDGQIVLRDFSLQLFSGELIAMVGPNGAGKTTVMRSLLGLLPLISGERRLNTKSVVYLPQRMALNPSLPLTVNEFLELKGRKTSSKNEINSALISVGLQDKGSSRLSELSGGQMQRVYAAFALLGNPRLICLDESTEGMDAKAQKEFLELLAKHAAANGSAILFISHDISAVSSAATRVVCINRNVLYDGSPTSPEFHSCLHTIYGNESVIHGHHHH